MSNAIRVMSKDLLKSENNRALTNYTTQKLVQSLAFVGLFPQIISLDGEFDYVEAPKTLQDWFGVGKGFNFSMTESSHYPTIDKLPYTKQGGRVNDEGFAHDYTKSALDNDFYSIKTDIETYLEFFGKNVNTGLIKGFMAGATAYTVPQQTDNNGQTKTFAENPLLYFRDIQLQYESLGFNYNPNVFILSPNRYSEYKKWEDSAVAGLYSYTGTAGYVKPDVRSAKTQMYDVDNSALDYICFDSSVTPGQLVIWPDMDYSNMGSIPRDVTKSISFAPNTMMPLSYAYSNNREQLEFLFSAFRSRLGYQSLNPLFSNKGTFDGSIRRILEAPKPVDLDKTTADDLRELTEEEEEQVEDVDDKDVDEINEKFNI